MSPTTEVHTSLCKRAEGLTFSTVVSAMNFSNISSSIQEEVDKFVRENGLADVPHIFMATHSWGVREWEITEDRKPAFFREEDLNGGWYIFREEDVSYMLCSSATSGSSLMAEKQEDGTWNLKLEVPIQEDEPYKGAYWTAFHTALEVSDGEPQEEDLTPVEELVESPAPAEEPLADWERELLK